MRRRCQVVNFDAGVAFKNSRRRSVANGRSNRFFCRLFLFFCWSFLSSLLLLLFRNENRSPCDAILLFFFVEKEKENNRSEFFTARRRREKRCRDLYGAIDIDDRSIVFLFVCLFVFSIFSFRPSHRRRSTKKNW